MALLEGALERVLKSKPEICETAEHGEVPKPDSIFKEEVTLGFVFKKKEKFGDIFSKAVEKLEVKEGKTIFNMFAEECLFNKEKIYETFEDAIKVAKSGKTTSFRIFSEKNENKERFEIKIRPNDVKNSEKHLRLLGRYIELIRKLCEAADSRILEEKRKKALFESVFRHSNYYM